MNWAHCKALFGVAAGKATVIVRLAALLLVLSYAPVGWAQSPTPVQPVPQPAQEHGAIDIPDGTAVVFHLYGGTTSFKDEGLQNFIGQKPFAFHALIQVDQNVTINNVVVVPRGSLGQVSVAAPSRGHFRSQFFSGYGITSFAVTPEFVFSVASTQLEFLAEPILLDQKHKNVDVTSNGVMPLYDGQFTGRLKHATIADPR